MWGWFLHFTGIDNPAGPWYAFWSGFGSDLGEVTLIGGIGIYLRHHNCHTHGCWRLGHPRDGVVQCRRHIQSPEGSNR